MELEKFDDDDNDDDDGDGGAALVHTVTLLTYAKPARL